MEKKLRFFPAYSSEIADFLTDVYFSYQGNHDPIENIIEALWGGFCKSVVVESDYIDKDYQDEFSAYYSKSFKAYPHRCIRLHFFSELVTQKQIDGFSLPENAYLGFTILRPIDLQRIGRTVLKPHIDEDKQVFITCKAEFYAHILGQCLRVTGMPFVQQDTQVGACAQASLWMLARFMSRRFRYREYLPAEINQFAKSHSPEGRLFPAERGLNPSQMLDALQAMGFSAELVWKESLEFSKEKEFLHAFRGHRRSIIKSAKLADIAYRYIESGLPVIFATTNHALVGIGHSYDFKGQARMAIQRIPSFYVNDDADGPYREMPVLRSKADCRRSFLEVEYIFVVAPHEATLRGEDAEEMAKDSLWFLLKEKKSDLLKKIKKMRPDVRSLFSKLEYRTYLKESTEFQKQLLYNIKQKKCKVSEKLIRLDYPKFIWVTEISSAKLLNYRDKKKRQCIGRIVVDSTAPKSTFGTMAIHFADLLLLHDRQKRDNETGAWKNEVFPNSTPFTHMHTSAPA